MSLMKMMQIFHSPSVTTYSTPPNLGQILLSDHARLQPAFSLETMDGETIPSFKRQNNLAQGDEDIGVGVTKYLPDNIQCIYTFVAEKEQRVKLEFTGFQLAGTADNCDMEYIDIYSELESSSDDLLSASLGGRYCGSVSPHVRISLHNVLVLVFHSRVGKRRSENVVLDGQYQFISDARYIPGSRLPNMPGKCAFLIEPRKNAMALSYPTYPGTYPSNFQCIYLLKGNPGDRIRLYFVTLISTLVVNTVPTTR
uniref:CUB domain-containing protein n=1 Tax=Ditylenchus dipsaci TaxID=166011 RepID=A0A915DHJ6_9BILA